MNSADSENSAIIFPSRGSDVSDSTSGYVELGRHGWSILGRATRHGMVWFVKSLDEAHRNLTECRLRLRKEYEIMLRLNHPGIARAVWFEESGLLGPAIFMELIEGETLDRFLKRAPRGDRREAALRILEAAACMHSAGVCHLDLKPGNIMVCRQGVGLQVKIIDFGMSDHAGSAVLKAVGGNRRYGAPEQFEAGYCGAPAADVWSLAVILGEMRCGLLLRMVAAVSRRRDSADRPSDAVQMLRIHSRLRNLCRISAVVSVVVFSVLALGLATGREIQGMGAGSIEKTAVADSVNTGIVGRSERESGENLPGLPVSDVSAAVPAADDPEEKELLESHAAIVASLRPQLIRFVDSLRDIAMDTTVARNRRSQAIGESVNRMDMHISAAFRPLRERCPRSFMSRRKPGWATILDPDLADCRRKVTDVLNDFVSSRDTLMD
ncbi:MAG: protein kinase [Paramuribaculum sp.]|nr:protein kinase [Paramuribaculum sp.]